MTIKEQLQAASRDALRNRDSVTRNYVNNMLSKFLELEKSEGFSGWTEMLEQDTIRSYCKALQKTVDQVGSGPVVEGYLREIAYLNTFLPSLMGEEETRALVQPYAEKARGLGPFLGLVMKDHKGKVDPALVRRIGQELGLK